MAALAAATGSLTGDYLAGRRQVQLPRHADSEPTGPRRSIVLRGAREMNDNLAMSDATYSALEAKLGREHVIDLIMTISFYCAVVRILATLQIDVEPDYQKYLSEHPLPA